MCSDFTATKLALGFLSVKLHFLNQRFKTVHPITFLEPDATSSLSIIKSAPAEATKNI